MTDETKSTLPQLNNNLKEISDLFCDILSENSTEKYKKEIDSRLYTANCKDGLLL